jgi:hypothetical protein
LTSLRIVPTTATVSTKIEGEPLGRYAFDLTGIDALAFRRHSEAWAEHLAV